MLKKYDMIRRFDVSARCLSPVRSGGSDAGMEAVLRDRDGVAFVQGASLAGAFREWVAGSSYKTLLLDLFGGQERKGSLVLSREGSLVFSDLRFQKDAEQHTRPRLRIDGATGANADHAKFDVAHIAKDSAAEFSIVWFGAEEDTREREAVRAMLAAMNGGVIRIGAQKTNGFGKLGLEVMEYTFRMRDAGDRAAWAEDGGRGEPLDLRGAAETRYVHFEVKGRLPGVLVKSGAPEKKPGGKGGSSMVTVNIQENETPLIPGSSIKGAVRARAEMIERFLSGGGETPLCERAFGRMARKPEDGEGDNGLAGRVRFSDAYLARPKNKDYSITRIRINKFTGGVMRGGLFSEQPLASKAELAIDVPAEDAAACGLILYALRDLGLGLFSLGSGSSYGRGWMENVSVTARTPEGRTLGLTFDNARTAALSDPDGLWTAWAEAAKGGTR